MTYCHCLYCTGHLTTNFRYIFSKGTYRFYVKGDTYRYTLSNLLLEVPLPTEHELGFLSFLKVSTNPFEV